MKVRTRIHEWETKLEKGPKITLISTCITVFFIALVFGFGFASGLSLIKKRALSQAILTVEQKEHEGMERRIEMLRQLRVIKR